MVQVFCINKALASFPFGSLASPKSWSAGHSLMVSEERTDHMLLMTPSLFPGFQSLYCWEELQVSKNSRTEGGAVNLSWPLSHKLPSLVRLCEWPQWMPLPTSFSAHHPTALRSSPVKIPYELVKLWDGSFNTRMSLRSFPWKPYENLLCSSRFSVHEDHCWMRRERLWNL